MDQTADASGKRGDTDEDRPSQDGRGRRGGLGRLASADASLKAGAAGLPEGVERLTGRGGGRKGGGGGRAARRRANQSEAEDDDDAPEGAVALSGDAGRAPDDGEAEDGPEARAPGQPAPMPEPETAPQTETEAEADADTEGEGQRGRGGRKGKGRNAEPKVVYIPPPTAPSARPRRRHWGVLASFLLLVIAPCCIAGWYLYERASDQYASTLAFSVRKEEGTSAFEDIGGVFGLGSNSSSDTDVLYEFIQSQELVERVDARIDLRAIYSKAERDWYFSVPPEATIEDLVDYWRKMVTIYYDAGSGLMEVRVLAFDPVDAQAVSRAILDESSQMINALSAIARDDATRYAREDLERAVEELKKARAAITEFRAANQIVNPESTIQIDLGLLGALNQQLAEAEIDVAVLKESAREGDPRVRQAEQRIEVIQNRIAEEQRKFGLGTVEGGRGAYATLVSEYESLTVDLEFAETTYVSALSNYNAAQAEATRQSRYLAPHIRPTLAQSSEYPRRETILLILFLLLSMGWMIVTMLYYSIKDRR